MIFARQKNQFSRAPERLSAYTLRNAYTRPKDYQLTHIDHYVVCSDLHKDFVSWRNFFKYQQVATRISVDQKRDLLREKYNGSNKRVVSFSTIAKSFCTLSTSLLAVFHL